MKHPITTLLFDFGNVFIDIDFQQTTNAIRHLGIDMQGAEEALFDPNSFFRKFQTGSISSAEFRDAFRNLAQMQLDDSEIDRIWCLMIGTVAPQQVELLQDLQGAYRLALFSNTDDIHAELFEREFVEKYRFPFSTLFDRVYYSQNIGFAKPDLEAFQWVIDDLNEDPQCILFLDDILKNIEGAKKAGLQAIQVIEHCNPRAILEQEKLI